MGKIPIIQKDRVSLGTHNNTLPTWYMADYSVIALVVDQIEAAARTLQENGFPLIEGTDGKTVMFDSPAGLDRIITLLRDHTIECSLSDSVTQIYQG